MSALVRIARWLARTACIVLLVMLGSTLLVRFAPGYLSDAREMDGRYARVARAELTKEAEQSHSLASMVSSEINRALHGDFGVSRQFGAPVLELIRPRIAVTGLLMLRALAAGWGLAFIAALFSGSRICSSMLWQAPSSILLAVPTAAMATLCLLTNTGTPVLVMALLLAARDFKFLHRTLHSAWSGPEVLHARAQGIRPHRLLWAHILPALKPRLFALASLSLVTALSALVPVEVIFDVPGLGQLAWNAALNRDLPILLAVTMIMALAVTVAGMTPNRRPEWGDA